MSEGGDSRPTTHERRCAKIAPDGGEDGRRTDAKNGRRTTGRSTAKETAGKTGGGQRKNDGAIGWDKTKTGETPTAFLPFLHIAFREASWIVESGDPQSPDLFRGVAVP